MRHVFGTTRKLHDSVTFSPTAVVTRTGSLTITDSAASSPQTVSLSGTGTVPDFTFATGGSATTATVTSRQTANYTLSLLAAAGFNGSVGLTCTQAPLNAHCTVSPSSLPLSAGKSSSFTVTVTTNSSSGLLLPRLLIVLAVGSFGSLIAFTFVWSGRRTFRLSGRLSGAQAYGLMAAVLMYVLIATAMVGCGGGEQQPTRRRPRRQRRPVLTRYYSSRRKGPLKINCDRLIFDKPGNG